MHSDHQHLSRGFNWLGGATVAAKLVDFSTTFAMLLLLTKRQVGIASIVISVGMIVEGLNGLGIGDALIQAPAVCRRQLDSLFWYILAVAGVTAGLALAAGPGVEALYGAAGISVYFVAVAAKQPLVGAALIPLAMMSRNLQYERIAVVNICATLAAALTRLGLGVAGAGSWALVAGYASSGLFVLIGASLAGPFRPRLPVRGVVIRPLVQFGLRSAVANVLEQVFKNTDFLLVGWFYGAASLAIYRVAFDIAMEPAMAVGTLVSRASLPVFSHAAAAGDRLAGLLAWSFRKIVVLVAPLMVALMLAAGPLTALLHDDRGSSYAAAAIPLIVLAAAAGLRVTAMLFSTVILSVGRPGIVAGLSAATLLLLASGIAIIGLTLPAQPGLIAVSGVWLGLYPGLLVWQTAYLRKRHAISLAGLIARLHAPAAGIVLMILAVALAFRLLGAAGAGWQLAAVVSATAATYAGLLLYDRRMVV